MKYEPVIGLEVHVELATRSKMFCPNSTEYFGQAPNIHTCPVCLGLPGSLPYINEAAIEDCIKIGLALNCKISQTAVFERKNYFYPDLPKGYQISQYRWPICRDGWIEIKNSKIRINRVHQEEDTAKLIHQLGSQDSRPTTQSYIDFNRSGVPLVEIVTEPDFHTTSEIKEYAKKLQQLFRYLNVSDADMEKGSMRLEANVSIRKINKKESKISLPDYRVELKNINSFRFMVQAVEYEIERQIQRLEKGEKLVQETRGWDEKRKQTYIQRIKEEAQDYRYFPDPDLPPIKLDGKRIKVISREMVELPWEKAKRLEKEYGLTSYQAERLTDTKELADYFEEAAKVGKENGVDILKIANTLINRKIDRDKILPADLIKILRDKTEKPLISDSELEKIIVQQLEQNPKAVEDYKKGKEGAIEFLLGQVLRNIKRGVDANHARKLLVIALQEM